MRERSRIAALSATGGEIVARVARTAVSIPATTASPSASRPWIASQRGLSGIHMRMKKTTRPSSRAGQEGEPPAELRVDERRVEQRDRDQRAERRADPEAAVDHRSSAAAIAGGDQFLDRRVDRGVFAADAGAGEEAKQEERAAVPGERRSARSRSDRRAMVMKNSFFRPSRSVSQPKNSAPSTAPSR